MSNPVSAYRCSNPQHPQEAPATYNSMTKDGFCPHCPYGEGILEAVSAKELARSGKEGVRARHSGEIGLCILACDVSGSMFSPCFPGNPARTIDVVARAAASGISDLYSLSNADDAFIAILPFADSTAFLMDADGKPFLKSISDIRDTYPTSRDLGLFLISAFKSANVGSFTDINAPLVLAKEIRDHALRVSLDRFGGPKDFTVKSHDLVDIRTEQTVSVPNIRVLLYSDGGHNSGELKNPFASDAYSPLLTMFFGEGSSGGAAQMRGLACTCPQHGRPGFFLIDAPSSYATLRHLFRMASGTSGFCPECSRQERIDYEDLAAV